MIIGAFHRSSLLVFLTLLVVVLVPSACVLWFLNTALENESLALRQKTDQIRRQHALGIRELLERTWSSRLEDLEDVAQLDPRQAFSTVVRAGLADAVVLLDDQGRPTYPAEDGPSFPRLTSEPFWIEAQVLERTDPGAAAARYESFDRNSHEPQERARALFARARCLALSGRRAEAIEIILGSLAGQDLLPARDKLGRMLLPNALYFTMTLMRPPGPDVAAPDCRGRHKRVCDLAARLASMLNDYSYAIPSPQRIHLMGRLQKDGYDYLSFPTLPAEKLANRYLIAYSLDNVGPGLSIAHPQTDDVESPVPLWHLSVARGRLVAIFLEDHLVDSLFPKNGLDADFCLAPATSPSAPDSLDIALPSSLSGWEIRVRSSNGDTLGSSARRNRIFYLWTALASIMAVLVVATIGYRFFLRQMRLTRLKSDLTATVTHELRTPLTSMGVIIDTLREDPAPGAALTKEYLSLLAKEQGRLGDLIDNFLAFSQLEQPRRFHGREKVDLSDVVSDAMASLGERIRQPDVFLELDVAGSPMLVRGEHGALVAVVRNLLDNALKYTGEQKRIRVRCRNERDGVLLDVSDNGPGVPHRFRRKIFERYFQIHGRLSSRMGGVGLGLNIARLVVEAHGGTLSLSNTSDQGSTFEVWLPGYVEEASDGTERHRG
ncbi:MAG: HAMP domain-containing histidine kinase [Deltaproteobacteria bacterium]|nr:HAMP domain-containing histidine kinase [Deltaproteobacteria bacterium]